MRTSKIEMFTIHVRSSEEELDLFQTDVSKDLGWLIWDELHRWELWVKSETIYCVVTSKTMFKSAMRSPMYTHPDSYNHQAVTYCTIITGTIQK